MRIYWTETAINQLETIFDYYSLKAGNKTARKITSSIVDKTILLENNPKIGQKEELLQNRKNEYRYIIEKNYKIIYWIETEQVNIASVFDCRQNPVKMKEIK